MSAKRFLLPLIFICLQSLAQTRDPSAVLQLNSSTQGLLPPRMTTAQRDAITNPAEGLLIFNTATLKINFYNGTAWVDTFGRTGTVISASGKTWLPKNLGANRIATASDDSDAYGYLYQWGRNSDGHQIRTSSVAGAPVASGSEGNRFLIISSGDDWLRTRNDTRWNGSTKGAHDPCPTGFRVPTMAELEAERLLFPSNNAAGAYHSVLKLPVAGLRLRENAIVNLADTWGYYWSSTVDGTRARRMYFSSTTAAWGGAASRAYGLSVRCIKE